MLPRGKGTCAASLVKDGKAMMAGFKLLASRLAVLDLWP
jgi:hypothetical protein